MFLNQVLARSVPALGLLALGWSGCVAVKTSEGTRLMTLGSFKRHASENLVGSLRVSEEVARGALQFRVEKGRWPATREEVLAGLVRAGFKPDFAGEVASLELTWEGSDPLYSFRMVSGPSWKVRIRVRREVP